MQQADTNHVGNDESASVKVWDRFLRFFHWTLVLCFVTAYISGEVRASTIHVLVGYVLCVLLVARVYWGFKGSEYARFRASGALMVFTMFGLLAVIFVSGLLTLGTIDFEGPMVFLANRVSDEASYAFRHIHQWLPNFALALVVLHLLGVVVGSIQHKENLVRAMLTGKKSPPSQSSSTSNRNDK